MKFKDFFWYGSSCQLNKKCFSELLLSAFPPVFFFFFFQFGTCFLKVGTILKTTKIRFRKLGFHCKPVCEYVLSRMVICTEITKQNVVTENMSSYFGEI